MTFLQGNIPLHVFNHMLTVSIALILGLAYTYAQDNRGKKVTFYVITFNVIFLPWAILLLTLVMRGPQAAMAQGTGLVAAHLYDFLTRLWPTFGGGRNYISTPNFVRLWFGGNGRNIKAQSYGTAYRPATAEAPSRGTSSGLGIFSGGSWLGRGQGRRLGGD